METGFAEGRCACGALSYRMARAPMIVHCCHCRQCQRETGAAFQLIALIERDALAVSGTARDWPRPTGSGWGLIAAGCGDCGTVLWNVYGVTGDAFAWIKVGTLDDPERCPPDVHIFTETRLDWVRLPREVPEFEAFYDPREVWSADAQARRRAALGRQQS